MTTNVELQVLFAANGLLIATVPLIALLYSDAKMSWFFSVSAVLQLITLVLGNLFLIPTYGIMGSAITRFIIRVVLLITTIVALLILYKKSTRSEPREA